MQIFSVDGQESKELTNKEKGNKELSNILLLKCPNVGISLDFLIPTSPGPSCQLHALIQ